MYVTLRGHILFESRQTCMSHIYQFCVSTPYLYPNKHISCIKSACPHPTLGNPIIRLGPQIKELSSPIASLGNLRFGRPNHMISVSNQGFGTRSGSMFGVYPDLRFWHPALKLGLQNKLHDACVLYI